MDAGADEGRWVPVSDNHSKKNKTLKLHAFTASADLVFM
jgi:hypothetical protein